MAIETSASMLFPCWSGFGFTATMFLPTASIGDRPVVFNRRECMTWAEVRELQQRGISFGSHTVTHPQLHGLHAGSYSRGDPAVAADDRRQNRPRRRFFRLSVCLSADGSAIQNDAALDSRRERLPLRGLYADWPGGEAAAILCFWNGFPSTVRTIRHCCEPNWQGPTTGWAACSRWPSGFASPARKLEPKSNWGATPFYAPQGAHHEGIGADRAIFVAAPTVQTPLRESLEPWGKMQNQRDNGSGYRSSRFSAG